MNRLRLNNSCKAIGVFIFVLKLNEFNDRAPPLSRIVKANYVLISMYDFIFTIFFCENYTS